MCIYKILHCIPSMEGGGAERQLVNLSRELVIKGCSIDVALIRGGANLENLELAGARVHKMKARNNYDPNILIQLIKLIRTINPDIVQVWLEQMNIIGGLSALLLQKPLLLTERSSAGKYNLSWKNRLRKQIAKRADLIVANSQGGQNYWKQQGIASDRIKIIRNLIPQAEINASQPIVLEDNGFPANTELIVFGGRFDEGKNIINLLQALRIVLAERPNAIALLFGVGSLLETAKVICQNKEFSDRVRLPGYTSDIWRWMKAARAYVSVSFFEGQPNSVFEAVASNCPVVLSDIPSHREILSDNSAWFVDPSSPSAIARGIIDCLKYTDIARTKARRASDLIKGYSSDSIASEYVEQYYRILAQRVPVSRSIAIIKTIE